MINIKSNFQTALIDCSEPHDTELFVVEGPSAAGAVSQWRDRQRQAVLPMQGKIPNSVRASTDRLLVHVQVADLLRSVQPQRKAELPLVQSRYQRVLLMCDPDVDGMHASLLLVLFFFQHAPELIEQGILHMVRVPLYAVNKGSDRIAHAYTKNHLNQLLKQFDSEGMQYQVRQFKGIGSLDGEMLKDCIAFDSPFRQQLSVSDCTKMCAQFLPR